MFYQHLHVLTLSKRSTQLYTQRVESNDIRSTYLHAHASYDDSFHIAPTILMCISKSLRRQQDLMCAHVQYVHMYCLKRLEK